MTVHNNNLIVLNI